jgi:hypothetical protein
MEKGGYRDSQKEEDFSVSHATFSFCVWVTWHFDDSDHIALIILFPFSDSFIEYYMTFIKFHVNADRFHWYETSRPK